MDNKVFGLSRWSNRKYSHGFDGLSRVDILDEVLTATPKPYPMDDLIRRTPGILFHDQSFLDIIDTNSLQTTPTDMRPQDLRFQGLSGDTFPYVMVSGNAIIGNMSELRDVSFFEKQRVVGLRDFGIDRVVFDRSQAKLGDGFIVVMSNENGFPQSLVKPLEKATEQELEGPFVLMPVNLFHHTHTVQRKLDYSRMLNPYEQRYNMLDDTYRQSPNLLNQETVEAVFQEKDRIMAHIRYTDDTKAVMPATNWNQKHITGEHEVVITPWNDIFIYRGDDIHAVAATLYGTHFVKPQERGKGYGKELALISEAYSPFSRVSEIPENEISYRLKKNALETLMEKPEYSPSRQVVTGASPSVI